jgi:predicted dehydrogenase
MTPPTDLLGALDVRVRLPERLDRGIGIVGAGAIVDAAHLPAYRQAGFNVVAIADTDSRAAQRAAAKWEIPRVYDHAQGLLDDDGVDIIDIAVSPEAQPAIAHSAIATGRSVLCQKPLAPDLKAAGELVSAASHAGVRLAVNQQMRWEPVVRANKLLLEAGHFGVPAGALYDVDVATPWESWPWLAAVGQLEYRYHSIHYLDSVRYLFGDPVAVTASVARYPGQTVEGETRTFTVLEYTGTLTVAILVNHNNWSTQPRAVIRCEGTAGRSEGRLGLFEDYPTGGPHSISFEERGEHGISSRTFDERWFPDAFAGPMAELQLAIEEDREPLTSGRDNLATLALVDAAYRSATDGRRVALDATQAVVSMS